MFQSCERKACSIQYLRFSNCSSIVHVALNKLSFCSLISERKGASIFNSNDAFCWKTICLFSRILRFSFASCVAVWLTNYRSVVIVLLLLRLNPVGKVDILLKEILGIDMQFLSRIYEQFIKALSTPVPLCREEDCHCHENSRKQSVLLVLQFLQKHQSFLVH